MKEYTQKELNEIWEQAVEILIEKYSEHAFFVKKYKNSFLYQEEKKFNIIVTSPASIMFIEENYKNYTKDIKGTLSKITGITNINVHFKSTRNIEPRERDRFEMMEERLDKIEELLIKNINK